MLRLLFSVLSLGSAVFVTSPESAYAVQTRRCPDGLTLSVRDLTVFSSEEILTVPRHAKYTKEMLAETFASRARAEQYLPPMIEKTVFRLKKKENAKCTYWVDGTNFPQFKPADGSATVLGLHRIVLRTEAGVNYFREEFTLPNQQRERETFVIESVLTDYALSGVKIAQNEHAPVKVTVRYPCYDHRCLSEANIGHGTQSVD